MHKTVATVSPIISEAVVTPFSDLRSLVTRYEAVSLEIARGIPLDTSTSSTENTEAAT